MKDALALRGQVDAVVVGASAGGVEALIQLLPAFAAGFQGAVIVVLHLPRDRRSLLVDIFQPRCALAVREAQDKESVAGGTIYFAPPDYHLLVDRGPDARPQLALSVDEAVNYSRPSIDVLFESAADVYRERLMGIVLTGGNQDGASGLMAVQRAGGVSVVQDPETAQVSLMPASALAAVKDGPVDFVLPLPDMADLLKTMSEGEMT
ncbi:chemotaxis protein CheB [Rhodoferax koreense]|uniref:protein-glutamate methylesterase n=1 Tax=Rhodoferax koreensis TaxID=1842727 RepID=A0A1P8JVZ2_9BURK|nr:chemotaxis protein CheB [Rhodoferax koreense]APW37914.1 chemotaxis protein CheB [Rhodoferax koreense]